MVELTNIKIVVDFTIVMEVYMNSKKYDDKPFSQVLDALVDEYENKKKTRITDKAISNAINYGNDWVSNKRKYNRSFGDIKINEAVSLSKLFEIPFLHLITGENPRYRQIKKIYGLNTPAIEWLKAHRDNTEIDYIGILNIILGDSKIAELVINSFYLYCMKDIYNFSEFEARGEIMENLAKAMDLVSARYEPTKIDNMEKQLEIILKDIKIAKDKVDEELQQIAVKKEQEIEDFEAEAQEYHK